MSKTWSEALDHYRQVPAPEDSSAARNDDGLFQLIEAVREESQTLRFELNTALLRIKALEEPVEDLLHGEAGESEIEVRMEEPEIRVRISHAHTLKDGWRCDSTTVEWTGRGGADWHAIKNELARAADAGWDEAETRNKTEQEAKAA